MKPKAKTLQERFGFADPELTTPAHDALMMWLDSSIEDWFETLPLVPSKWDYWVSFDRGQHTFNPEIDKAESALKGRIKRGECSLPSIPPAKLVAKKWETPIVGHNAFIIGFADMRVEYLLPCLKFLSPFDYSIEWEDGTSRDKKYQCYFEVKPSIKSLGEVIRQIRMYQTFVSGKWFVVSPDNKFVSTLADQGIGFVEAPRDL